MTTPILFDLDGTLLDTAQDFAHTINLMLAEISKPPVDFYDFRAKACVESNNMIAYAFDITADHVEFGRLRQQFLNLYQKNCTHKTCFFTGITTVLDFLDAKKIPWGIVTNKPSWLTEPVVNHFNLDKRAVCIISGDTLSTKKPDPEPLIHACKLIGVAPEKAVYVGDLETDMIAARAANMKSITAAYGYCAPNADLKTWQADFIAQHPTEILQWLQK